MKVFQLIAIALLCFNFLSLSACKRGYSSESSTEPTPTPPPEEQDKEYHGAGSSWELFVDEDNNTFDLDRRSKPDAESPDLEIEGNTTELSSDFIEFEVTKTSNTLQIAVGDLFYGIQVGEEITVLSPNSAEQDHILFLSRANNCPSLIGANWVVHKFPATTDDNHADGHFGIYSYSPTSGTASVELGYELSTPDTSLDGLVVSEDKCDTDGVITSSNNRIYFSQGSSAVLELSPSEDDIDKGTNTQLLVTLEKKTLSAATDFDGKHLGFLKNTSQQDGEEVDLVNTECTSGTCTISFISDPENGDTETDTYTLVLPEAEINKPSAGFVIGTLTNASDEESTIACSVNNAYGGTSKAFFGCIGYAPGDTSNFTHLFLVSE